MAAALRQSRSFDSASPVMRYWLANCVGFSVTGGGRGTVAAILCERDPNEPDELVVRLRAHRLKRLPVSSVVAVVPAERRLVVERGERPAAARTRVAGRAAGGLALRGSIVAARLLAFAAGHGWRLTRRGVARAAPHVVRVTREGGTRTVRLVRSVPWQRYARSARSGMTKLSQGRFGSS